VQQFQSLTKYINLMPFTNSFETEYKFVQDVYAFQGSHPEYGLERYNELLEQNGLEWSEKMSNADVSDKDAQCVLALIVGAVRAERFCDGALRSFFENGSIKKWLARLLEIDEGDN
jgi:hypothetical protein